jgi:hypothetical protein
MKKLLLSITFLLTSICVYAQQDSIANSVKVRSAAIGHGGNNEIKVNLLYMTLGIPEISYERLIADNMGLGLSTMVSLSDDEDMNLGLLATYRLYFGTKKANGFFIEGNTGVITKKEYVYSYEMYAADMAPTRTTKANFALGAACGAKFLTRNGFLGEAYLGVDRLLGGGTEDFYPRIGITIGKRF